MSLIKAASIRRVPITTPDMAGQVHKMVFSHTFGVDVTTTDVLELGGLPARAQILGARLEDTGIAATNFDIGFMSGNYGDAEDTRTSGAELFSAQAAGTPAEMTLAEAIAIPRADNHRSIGLVPDADVTAGAKTVWVEVEYML